MSERISHKKAAQLVRFIRREFPDATLFSNPRKLGGRMLKLYRVDKVTADKVGRFCQKNKIHVTVEHVCPPFQRYKFWCVYFYTDRSFMLKSVPRERKSPTRPFTNSKATLVKLVAKYVRDGDVKIVDKRHFLGLVVDRINMDIFKMS